MVGIWHRRDAVGDGYISTQFMVNRRKLVLGILCTVIIIVVPGSFIVLTLWALYKARRKDTK